MKTVVYQIPVEPVERREGKDLTTATADALQKINNQAYHLANRAITLFLNYLYPEPDKELLRLKEVRQSIKLIEERISGIYKNQTSAPSESDIDQLLEQKRSSRKSWEEGVADCQFYKEVKDTIREEFPDFPEFLRKNLLRKVVLDWLYSWMNQDKQTNFSANFPFYRHGTHLPLCYGKEEIRWEKNATGLESLPQYTLRWLDGIHLKTNFEAQDKRLPKVLEALYFQTAESNVRNRKAHDTLMPTLKLGGTKWSIHIPVLENVSPIQAEKEDALVVVFGFHYPIAYAFGVNHAKPLAIDNGKYILQQMKEFERRIEKIEHSFKKDEKERQNKIEKVFAARAAYIEALQVKAVKAIIELAKKGQKNLLAIESWPVITQEQKPMPDEFKQSKLPSLYERLLCGIPHWNFESFYGLLKEEGDKYGIRIDYFSPRWDYYKLYTSQLSYTIRNNTIGRSEKKSYSLNEKQRTPSEFYGKSNITKQNEKLEGYMTFKLDRQYNDTYAQLMLYSSPRDKKRETNEFIYRIHIDINMAMNVANEYRILKKS